MNKILLDRVSAFNKKIDALTIKQAAKEAKEEVKKLLEEYTPRTVRAYLTTYRKSLSSDKSLISSCLSIPKKEQLRITKQDNKRIARSQRKGIEVRNVEQMIDKAISLLDSDNIGELVAALCLMTGRRSTEILKTAKFTNSKNSQRVLYFRGQLKTDDINLKYEIYVLKSMRDKCKLALKKVRSIADTKNMTNYQVSRKYENIVNSACSRLFSRNIGRMDLDRCTAHSLRNIYALYCLENYKKDKAQKPNSFLSQILGHGEDDVTTANSYQKYYLK